MVSEDASIHKRYQGEERCHGYKEACSFSCLPIVAVVVFLLWGPNVVIFYLSEAQHNEVAYGSKDTIDYGKDKAETLEDKSADRVLSIDEGYIDHQQGKLISQFEAEENAQREWEEKIQEKDNCSPGSPKSGEESIDSGSAQDNLSYKADSQLEPYSY